MTKCLTHPADLPSYFVILEPIPIISSHVGCQCGVYDRRLLRGLCSLQLMGLTCLKYFHTSCPKQFHLLIYLVRLYFLGILDMATLKHAVADIAYILVLC